MKTIHNADKSILRLKYIPLYGIIYIKLHLFTNKQAGIRIISLEDSRKLRNFGLTRKSLHYRLIKQSITAYFASHMQMN